MPGALVRADAEYDCETSHVFCRERLGVRALIPAKTRRYVARLTGRDRRGTRCATLGVEGEAAPQETYRQRWLVETLPARRWRRDRSSREVGRAADGPPSEDAEGAGAPPGARLHVCRLVVLGV